jgi:hypothetical protein
MCCTSATPDRTAMMGDMTTALAAAPGDVLAVWTSSSLASDLIRVGEALRGLPAVANHVAIVTHQDQQGRWIGIQGQPGGVGLVDCTPWLSDSRTRSNHGQPKPNDKGQLTTLLGSCAKSLGLQYDWMGIAEDACAALRLTDLSDTIDWLWRWSPNPEDQLLHGEVVCSSLAALLYDLPEVGYPHPDLGSERRCEPADWWQWSDGQKWAAAG